MNDRNFEKLAVVLVTVYLLGLFSFGALVVSVVLYNEKTHAMSATVSPSPVVMHPSTIGNDEVSLVGHTTIRFSDCMADHATGDLYTTENPYCLTGESGAPLIVKTHGSNGSTNPTSTSIPPIVTNENPPSNPSTPVDNTPHDKKDKKVKVACNNGEGNGSENCSPANSTHANNDENNTTPREDKSKGKN